MNLRHNGSMAAAFEELIAFITAQLPAPVQQDFEDDGSVSFVGGEPAEVIVRLTATTVTVAEYTVRWEGPLTPVAQPVEVAVLHWETVSGDAAMRVVRTLIGAAREARLSKYATCQACEKITPPEWMHDDEICQACAERERRVVH